MSLDIHIVTATSVEDYLTRYYKPEKLVDYDNSFGQGFLLEIYKLEYEVFGLVVTSHHDNVTGRFIAWPKYEEPTKEQLDRHNKLREELDRKFWVEIKVKEKVSTPKPKQPDYDLDIFSEI